MPKRNEVPTLRLLAIRQIAWPGALFKINQIRHPTERFGTHRKSHVLHNANTYLHHGTHPEHWRESISPNVEAIINAWIQLSDYYRTRLDEIKDLKYLFGFRTVETLDFLHTGFSLRDGTEVSDFAGAIPTAIAPQAVNPYTWQEISTLVNSSGNSQMLRNLHIFFDLTSTASHASTYHFMKTFSTFTKLAKLVVHGVADDTLMHALGVHCHSLKHLDIRHTQVTEHGIINLLLNQHADIKKFTMKPHFTFPVSFLRPLCKTLEYFDMSTVVREGELLDQDRVVRHSCPQLRCTPNRFFFHPPGILRFRCHLDPKNDLSEVRSKAISSARTQFADTLVELTAEFVPFHHQSSSMTGVEFRVTPTGEEASILYFHRDFLLIEIQFEALTAISITSHTISTCDFLPLESLVKLTPQLRHIKASLRGSLQNEQELPDLETVTMPMVHKSATLTSILRLCRNLVYIEARELLQCGPPGRLTDADVKEMMADGCPYLESFRILFPTDITLVPGVKDIILGCPRLKIIGDLKHWAITNSTLSRFGLNINIHNLDITYEHGGALYHPNTPCKEFYQ